MKSELPELAKLVKEIWIHSDKWRIKEGIIEFSILRCDNECSWFPFWQSPNHVEKFVRKWIDLSGINK